DEARELQGCGIPRDFAGGGERAGYIALEMKDIRRGWRDRNSAPIVADARDGKIEGSLVDPEPNREHHLAVVVPKEGRESDSVAGDIGRVRMDGRPGQQANRDPQREGGGAETGGEQVPEVHGLHPALGWSRRYRSLAVGVTFTVAFEV